MIVKILAYLLLYLVLGGFLSYWFIYSGKYRMRSPSGRKIDSKWKFEKASLIALLWPYVIVKGWIDSLVDD